MSARDFALLAQEAYRAVPDIGRADSASRAIVRTTAAGLCVAFPGTDNVASWLADLDVLTVDVPGVGPVHKGFLDAWKVIESDVLKAIGNQPVTLVGHSLGGALSIVGAMALKLSGKPPVAVFAFEPPRVSPSMGVRTFLADVQIFATRNGLDIVTNVPPGWNQSSLLKHIGHAALPIDNVIDHEMARVVAALAAPTVAA